jgi:integrase
MGAQFEALQGEIRALRAGPAPIRLAWLYKRFAKAQGRAGRKARGWQLVRNLLAPLIRARGPLEASKLTPTAWAEHIDERLRTPTRSGAPPMPSTLNLELRRARQLLRWGVRQKLLAADPLEEAKPLEAIQHRETWLTWEQVGQLVDACEQLRFPYQRALLRAFVLVGVATGMRFNEVRRLRRSRIGAGGAVDLSRRATKTRRQRIVALDEPALRAVADVDVIVGDDRVFASARTGNLWNETSLRNWFRRAVELAGLDAAVAEGDRLLVPHDLRHTAASLADEGGASPLDIRDMLGHSSLATTEHYLHRRQREKAAKMADVMGRRGPQPAIDTSHKNRQGKVDSGGP